MVYNLKPFAKNNDTLEIQISVEVTRDQSLLSLHYHIQDPTHQILISKSSTVPARKKGLWKTTCFEAFWKTPISAAYWELNFSANLDWNIYSFEKYRYPQEQEESRYKQLKMEKKSNNGLDFSLQLDLGKCQLQEQILNLGLACVLQHKNNNKSYWALEHVSEKPDFHTANSFKIII